MPLKSTYSYSPKEHAHFLNQHAIIALHPNCQYLAFTNRQQQLILRNLKTGRNVILDSPPPVSIIFTNDHLIVLAQNTHEVLVYSLKTQKLKKALTGHTTQPYQLAYCPQKKLLATISHDICLIYDQSTLGKSKTLKCSTSAFTGITFTPNAQSLITTHQDNTLLIFSLEDYSHETFQSPLTVTNTATNNSLLALYNSNSFYLVDLTQQTLVPFLVDQFWQGSIIRLLFVDSQLLLQTNQGLYLTDPIISYKPIFNNTQILTDDISLITTQFNRILHLTSNFKDLIISEAKKKQKQSYSRTTNPLTNEGLTCAGGFSSEEGCHLQQSLPQHQTHPLTHQLQSLTATTYSSTFATFTLPKLQAFIQKHHALPDKHRALAYQFLLQLPINSTQFRLLEQKGRHECTLLLDSQYPLNNQQLAEKVKDVISLLAHYNPIFAQSTYVPPIIFPFVCLFGNDTFLTFQILYRLFTRPLAFLFENFPLPNVNYLHNIHQILFKADPSITQHITTYDLPFTKIAWTLLSTLFTSTLPRESFLSVIDNIFIRPKQPQFLMFFFIAYLIHLKNRFFTVKSLSQLDLFLQQEHTLHLPKLLNLTNQLHSQYYDLATFQFKIVSMNSKNYEILPLPFDAITLQRNQRKLNAEEYLSHQQQVLHHDQLLQQMESMLHKTKTDHQRLKIERQAQQFLTEQSSPTYIPSKNNLQTRINKIQQLIQDLTQLLKQKHQDQPPIRIPTPQQLQNHSHQQLQSLELQLTKLLTQIQLHSHTHPLNIQPPPPIKNTPSDHRSFKSAVQSKIARELWQIDQLQRNQQQHSWQNQMLKSLYK